jgi:hypothetical protein
MDVLARLLSSDCSAPARYQHLQAIWAQSESRQPLVMAFLSVPMAPTASEAPALAEVGLFLLAHLSRRRSCREAILDQLLRCPAADADLLDWLELSLERRQYRLKVAAALMPRYPDQILAWLSKRTAWPGMGSLLQGQDPDQILSVFLKKSMGGPFDPVVADNLCNSMPWQELRPRLYAHLENCTPWIQAWILRLLGREQDPALIEEMSRWLQLPFTPPIVAAVESLANYPLSLQISALALALAFRSKRKESQAPYLSHWVYEEAIWRSALTQVQAQGLEKHTEAVLLQLFPTLASWAGPLDSRNWLLLWGARLLISIGSDNAFAAILNCIETALNRKFTVTHAYKLLETLNRSRPDWPLPLERVLPWIEAELSWAQTYAQERPEYPDIQFPGLYVLDFQRWFIHFLFQRLKRCSKAELAPLLDPLWELFWRFQPQRSRLEYLSPGGYDPGAYEHGHLIRCFLGLFREYARPQQIHQLLDTLSGDPLLQLPVGSPYDLQKPLSDPGWFDLTRRYGVYEDLLHMAGQNGNQETLERIQLLVTQAEGSLLPTHGTDQWHRLTGTLAWLRRRQAQEKWLSQ